ncbi:hypothetical protein LA080_004363 [Diaporthe eres]|nr:hypothetical protein LA080_004363 [Diaporthe eres]
MLSLQQGGKVTMDIRTVLDILRLSRDLTPWEPVDRLARPSKAAMSTTPRRRMQLQNPPANADYIHRNRTPKDLRISAEKLHPKLGRIPQYGARPGINTNPKSTATVRRAGVPCPKEVGACYTWYFPATWNVVGGFTITIGTYHVDPVPLHFGRNARVLSSERKTGQNVPRNTCRSASTRIHQLETGTTRLGAF